MNAIRLIFTFQCFVLIVGCKPQKAPKPTTKSMQNAKPNPLNLERKKNLNCDDSDVPAYSKFEADGEKLYMYGEIDRKTPKRLRKALNQNPQIKVIVMECVPGSLDDVANLKAARMVRQKGLNVHLASTGLIASGGTDFFLAGVKRTIGESTYIGVHSWGTEPDEPKAVNFPKDHEEHDKYLDYYQDMGIDEAFYWFTLKSADAEGMHKMTDAEIRKYGLVNEWD